MCTVASAAECDGDWSCGSIDGWPRSTVRGRNGCSRWKTMPRRLPLKNPQAPGDQIIVEIALAAAVGGFLTRNEDDLIGFDLEDFVAFLLKKGIKTTIPEDGLSVTFTLVGA
jgi:hypothetical protein